MSPCTMLIRKPGQITNSRLHFVAYYIHVDIPKDSDIYNDLLTLPNFYHLFYAEPYQKLFESLIRHHLKNPDDTNNYYISAKLLELFYHLKKDATQNSQAITPNAKKTLAIQKAIAYMKKNFDKKVTLQQLASLTKLSPSHFQKVFSSEMSMSPLKYLEGIRINQAKFLLMEHKASLVDIAYSCGFSSQSYFSSQFKRLTGLSPKEFQTNANAKYME